MEKNKMNNLFLVFFIVAFKAAVMIEPYTKTIYQESKS